MSPFTVAVLEGSSSIVNTVIKCVALCVVVFVPLRMMTLWPSREISAIVAHVHDLSLIAEEPPEERERASTSTDFWLKHLPQISRQRSEPWNPASTIWKGSVASIPSSSP